MTYKATLTTRAQLFIYAVLFFLLINFQFLHVVSFVAGFQEARAIPKKL